MSNTLNKEIIDIKNEFIKKYQVLTQKNIESEIDLELDNWRSEVSKKLNITDPFYNNKKELVIAKEEFEKNKNSIFSIKNDLNCYNNLTKICKIKIDNKFWDNEINKLESLEKRQSNSNRDTKLKIVNKKNKNKNLEEEQLICRKCLHIQWQKSLEEEYLKWEINEVNNYRNKLFNKLKNWLDLLEEMNQLLSSLSIETGVLFDMSLGNISLRDIDELKRWVEFISKTKGVKELCDLLGKIRKAEKSNKEEKIKSISYIKETISDINSNEEIVGIKLGREIEHALPQEIALLSDEDTSLLFDLKYIEGRLLCFDMEGIQENIKEEEEEKIISVSEEEKLGPIIICVDTSGSMNGSPELIAKAVTLYMATRAITQKRNCFLINFSTEIETFDLSGKVDLKEVINFLRKSFNGGTDVGPALNYALELMKKENYEKADLLIISDFIMSSLSNNLVNKIKDAKESNNKFYSLVIGNIFLSERIRDIFDNEWVYNPNNSSINNLNEIVDSINRIK